MKPLFYLVVSDSMFPEIQVGDLVIVSAKPIYEKGAVITYKLKGSEQHIVSHRIIDVTPLKNGVSYITKGDNNGTPDPIPVTKNEILGKVIFTISSFQTYYTFSYLFIIIYLPLALLLGATLRRIVHHFHAIINS